MDLENSTFLLKNILVSELDQKITKNRAWARRLAEVLPSSTAISLRIVKTLSHTLPSRPFVLKVPSDSIALYTDKQLHKMGVERLNIPGYFQYFATADPPLQILFRKKKLRYTQTNENAAQIVDIRSRWFEILPYEIRLLTVIKKGGVVGSKLVLRGAAWLENVRHKTEYDILHIGNEAEWKKASKKERAKLDYCSIAAFDRILIIDLLRKNWMALTPKAIYSWPKADAEVKASTPKALHRLIIGVNARNRTKFCSPEAKKVVQDWIPKD